MSKIESQHLKRRADVYVRQSTMAQVERNTESRERQYELVNRAVELGWHAPEVVVVDEDQGRSGKSTDGRDGFQSLVAEVGLGRVGIVLGIEVSRLARNNARLVPAAGSVRADRHADRRFRRRLSPRAAQRPAGARAQGHDERGRAARAARAAAWRQLAQGGQGRAAAAAARRLGVRRDRVGADHPGRGGRRRDRDRVLVLRSAAERQAGDAAAARGGAQAAAPSDQRPAGALGQADLQGGPRHPHQPRLRRRLRLRAQAHRAARGERRGPRAPASRAARGLARVHRRPPPRLHHLRALPRQPGATARRTGARRAGRAAAPRARAGRCCRG